MASRHPPGRRIAGELGISIAGFRILASRDKAAADLLTRRLETLRLDPGSIDPALMRDRQRSRSRRGFLGVVGRMGIVVMRTRAHRSPTLPGLGRPLPERVSVQHSEPSQLAKAKAHRGLRHASPLLRQHASHLAQPQILKMAVRCSSPYLAERSRQRPLVDPGDAAHICQMDEISQIRAGNLFEMIDDLSVSLGSLRCHDRTPIANEHGGKCRTQPKRIRGVDRRN